MGETLNEKDYLLAYYSQLFQSHRGLLQRLGVMTSIEALLFSVVIFGIINIPTNFQHLQIALTFSAGVLLISIGLHCYVLMSTGKKALGKIDFKEGLNEINYNAIVSSYNLLWDKRLKKARLYNVGVVFFFLSLFAMLVIAIIAII